MEEGSSIAVGLVFGQRMSVGLVARLEEGRSVHPASARRHTLVRKEVVVVAEVWLVAAVDLGRGEIGSMVDDTYLGSRRFSVVAGELDKLLTAVRQSRSILLLPWWISRREEKGGGI